MNNCFLFFNFRYLKCLFFYIFFNSYFHIYIPSNSRFPCFFSINNEGFFIVSATIRILKDILQKLIKIFRQINISLLIDLMYINSNIIISIP